MELAFVEDEQEEIRLAQLSIPQDDEQQLGDFQLGNRIAVGPEYAGEASGKGFNEKRKKVYADKLKEFEGAKGKKASRTEVDNLWNSAFQEATTAATDDDRAAFLRSHLQKEYAAQEKASKITGH